MIFSSTSVIAEVYAGARSDATAHAAHAGASRFPRAAIGLTWQVLSLASRLGCRAGQARYGLDGVLAAIGLTRHPAGGRGCVAGWDVRGCQSCCQNGCQLEANEFSRRGASGT